WGKGVGTTCTLSSWHLPALQAVPPTSSGSLGLNQKDQVLSLISGELVQDVAQLAADDLEPGLGVLSALPKHSRAFLLLDHHGGRHLAAGHTAHPQLDESHSEPPPRGCVLQPLPAATPALAAQPISLLMKPMVVTEWICKPSLMSLAQHQNKPGLAKLMLGPNTIVPKEKMNKQPTEVLLELYVQEAKCSPGHEDFWLEE
ncbi:hypothetical protein EI555_009382, partial [Monodon monoceros]